jgi:hypothetical protein
MSAEQFQELEAEYERLKAAARRKRDVNESSGPSEWFQVVGDARWELREFCLATGKDITLLQSRFNEEDLALANLGS